MPEQPPNLKIVPAEPPLVYMQPANPAPFPVLFVGGIKVIIDNKQRAGQWARWLLDYALSD